MRTLLVGVLLVLAVVLTLVPIVDASRQRRDARPWILAGLLFGPLSGVAYLMTRRTIRMAAERSRDSESEQRQAVGQT
jgi:hypothetical protein